MAIPETIKKLANDIRTKIYGREVREALAQGIEEAGSIADQANQTSNAAVEQVRNIQAQVDQLVVEGDSSVEAAQARVDADGNVYTTLKERLDTKETQFANEIGNLNERLSYLEKVDIDKGTINGVDSTFWNFKKLLSYRNFYNSHLLINKMTFGEGFIINNDPSIKYHGGNLYHIYQFSPNSPITVESYNNMLKLSNNNSNQTSSEVALLSGLIQPFATYEFTVESQVLNGLYATAVASFHPISYANRLFINVRHGTTGNSITVEKWKGSTIIETKTLYTQMITGKYTIRIQLTSINMHVYFIKDGVTTYLGSVLLSDWNDFTDKKTFQKIYFSIGGRLFDGEQLIISEVKSYYSSGVGQSDNYLITYEDKTPIINNNKAYLTMTTRVIDVAYQGIYSLDLSTFETNLVGVLFFEDEADPNTIRNYVASSIIFDRKSKEYIITTVNFGWGHSIQYGKTKKNILNGVNYIRTKQLNYPSEGNEEDCNIRFNEETNKWNFIMCKYSHGQNGLDGYFLYQYEADSIEGELTLVNKVDTAVSFTGVNYVRIGNKMYIACGKCWENETDGLVTDRFYLYDPDTLTQVGRILIDTPLNSYNTWCTIIPIYDGVRTKYIMMTFDRGNLYGKSYTYGSLYFFKSDFEREGYDYDYYINENTQ